MPSSLRVGDRFISWEIRGFLGKGGYGFVYDAYDILLDVPVALKILPTTPELKWAKNEAKVALKLHHRNIVETRQAGVTEDGVVFFAMERLYGHNLRQAMAVHGCFKLFEMLVTAWQIADAVSYAHTQDVIHRDLKLDNVFMQDRGVIRVLDFGIAKMLGEAPLTTQKDLLRGTPYYFSPEQLQGRPASFQSDIFAIGVMMFELRCGMPPARLGLESFGFEAIAWAQLNTRVPPLNELFPETPDHVALIVQRCLAKNPNDRYATAAELAADCRASVELLVAEAAAQGIELTSRPLWETHPVANEAAAADDAAPSADASIELDGPGALADDGRASVPMEAGQTLPLYRLLEAVVATPPVHVPAQADEARPVVPKAPQLRPRLRRPAAAPARPVNPAESISGVVASGTSLPESERAVRAQPVVQSEPAVPPQPQRESAVPAQPLPQRERAMRAQPLLARELLAAQPQPQRQPAVSAQPVAQTDAAVPGQSLPQRQPAVRHDPHANFPKPQARPPSGSPKTEGSDSRLTLSSLLALGAFGIAVLVSALVLINRFSFAQPTGPGANAAQALPSLLPPARPIAPEQGSAATVPPTAPTTVERVESDAPPMPAVPSNSVASPPLAPPLAVAARPVVTQKAKPATTANAKPKASAGPDWWLSDPEFDPAISKRPVSKPATSSSPTPPRRHSIF